MTVSTKPTLHTIGFTRTSAERFVDLLITHVAAAV